MTTAAFDTHAYVKKLTEVGFTEPQAETLAQAQAELINSQLASKRDLKDAEVALTRDLREVEANLKRDLKEAETKLTRDLREVEANLKRDLKELELRLEARLADTKAEIIRWTVGAGVLQTALIAALLLKLVH
jgi:hypothetical protein